MFKFEFLAFSKSILSAILFSVIKRVQKDFTKSKRIYFKHSKKLLINNKRGTFAMLFKKMNRDKVQSILNVFEEEEAETVIKFMQMNILTRV